MAAKSTKKVVETTRSVGVDGGNGSAKMYFEGVEHGLTIPTAEKIVLTDDSDLNFILKSEVTPENIHEHLDITFVSSRALKYTNERYLIGEKSLENREDIPKETTKDSKKFKSELVARTILAGLLVDAIRHNPEKKKVTAKYDLSLALPLGQINEEAFKQHAERFIGTHELIFHYANGDTIEVTIIIEFAMTMPEGAIGAFAVVYDFDGGLKKYQVIEDGEDKEVTFEDRELLISDIGAGTLDCAVMKGVNFDAKSSESQLLGSKVTIDKITRAWNSKYEDKIDSLIEFNRIYSNSEHRNHTKLRTLAKPFLRNDAISIAVFIKKLFINKKLPSWAKIIIYGGGAILYKEQLEDLFEEYEMLDKVIFKSNPVFTNAEGLLIFALHPMFQQLKQQYLEAVNV